ncbi:radical SAM protein [Desulfoluna limicola]|nr:radical SAM protein [Desulfoluna limicola]
MDYEGMIFRPPSEAYSILLQVTVGCSHNKCTFCEMYKEKKIFKIKSDKQIMKDLAFAARNHRHTKRLFLCDGDALILPQKRLVNILNEIKRQLPWVDRVGTYANTKSIAKKSVEELKELKDLGLSIAYMGLETGDDETLSAINKGADAARMIDMGQKIRSAGIKLSVTVLLGVAGRERSMIHAQETGRVLSAIDPEFVGALSLMLTPGTPLYKDHKAGKFPVLEPDELLRELGAMIAATHLTNGLFHSNHASNYLPIRAKLPEEKEGTLELINRALQGKVALKPEHLRAL